MTTEQTQRRTSEADRPAAVLPIIALVARREFITRVRTRVFLISTAVFLALIVGGILAFSVFGQGGDPAEIEVVGDPELVEVLEQSAAALDVPVDLTTGSSAGDARDNVADGELDVAITGESSYVVTSQEELDPELQAVIGGAVRQLALDRALDAQEVDREQLAEDVAATEVSFDTTEPSDPDQEQRMALAYLAVFLLFLTVYLYGLYVAMGVVEEKASRVVELLLATIKPIHLLTGKVLGIGAIGLAQVVLFGGAAVAVGMATDVVTVGSTALALLGAVVLWYILGFAFFAVLYAAFGSLVSRQEDVNSATGPLSLVSFATFFAAQAALSDPDATWVRVLAWIPPFSSTMQPVRIAADVASPIEVVGTMLLMAVLLVAVAFLAAAIYRRSVLNIGARQSLRQVLERDRRVSEPSR